MQIPNYLLATVAPREEYFLGFIAPHFLAISGVAGTGMFQPLTAYAVARIELAQTFGQVHWSDVMWMCEHGFLRPIRME